MAAFWSNHLKRETVKPGIGIPRSRLKKLVKKKMEPEIIRKEDVLPIRR